MDLASCGNFLYKQNGGGSATNMCSFQMGKDAIRLAILMEVPYIGSQLLSLWFKSVIYAILYHNVLWFWDSG